jgi:hypothetical protein
MNARLHSLGVALGFTTLALIWIPGPLNRDAFHWAGRPLALFLPITIDFIVAWLVFAALLHAVRRAGRLRQFVWSTLLAFAPIFAVEGYALLPGNYVSSKTRFVLGLACLLFWLLLNTLLSRLFARHADAIIQTASVVLLFLSINGVYVLSHTLWLGWQARHLNTATLAPSVLRPVPAGRPRIVWILMDGLSQQQVYDHRQQGLSLPAFDALASQSSVFTNVTPAANVTELAMPDYMTGIPDSYNYYAPNGQFDLRRLDTGSRIAFNQHDTIFEDAHHYGYNTGISGWYIPYCRLLPAVADRCFWTDSRPNRNGMVGTQGIVWNIFAPFRRIAAYAVPTRLQTPWFTLESNGIVERKAHIADYQNIVSAADQLLLDKNVDFILVHIPVPHLPGIYDRRKHALSAEERYGYLANLVLADQYLAHLRSVLESTGQWDTSTVLIMGDHSWRLGMEVPADVVAALGGFDPRPAYIVKLAGQHQPAKIDAPYAALRTRSLLQALLQQKIRTPEDLSLWVQHAP